MTDSSPRLPGYRSLLASAAELPAAANAVELTLLDHVIAQMLAGVRSPRTGRKPAHRTRVDRDYENLRICCM